MELLLLLLLYLLLTAYVMLVLLRSLLHIVLIVVRSTLFYLYLYIISLSSLTFLQLEQNKDETTTVNKIIRELLCATYLGSIPTAEKFWWEHIPLYYSTK